MSDIVERLRERAESYRMGGPSSEHTAAMLDEAATAIERMCAEIARLTAQLEEARAIAKSAWLTCPFGELADADLMSQLSEHIADRIKALTVSP